MATLSPSGILNFYSDWLSALQHYREFEYAMITVLAYDYLLTIGKEVDVFWHSRWNLSKVLYLLIRYLSLWLVVLLIIVVTAENTGVLVFLSNTTFTITYALAAVIMIICQAAIALRVWYLFSRDRVIRTITIITFCACTAASAVLVNPSLKQIKTLFSGTVTMTRPQNLGSIVWLYVPPLIMHTILFALKLYRFARSRGSLHVEAPLRRFLKEGMLMYTLATGSLVFTIICLTFTQPSQISVFLLALASFPATATVISVCRAMLSIGSLAATFHVDPAWLLNHAEMSRLQLRGGISKTELCVEIYGP